MDVEATFNHAMLVALYLMTVHYIADFRLQNDWMAMNKSQSNKALLAHVGVYAGVFLFATWSLTFTAVTFVLHFATDYVTSRITSRQWPFVPYSGKSDHVWVDATWTLSEPLWGERFERSRHGFFGTIGLDQWLHAAQLLMTAALLGFGL